MKKNRILSFIIVLTMLIQLVGTMGVVFAADSNTIVVNPGNTEVSGEGLTATTDGTWHVKANDGVYCELKVPVTIKTDGFYDVTMDIAAVLEKTHDNATGWWSPVKYNWDSETEYKYLKTYASAEEPEVTALHVSGELPDEIRKYKLAAPKYLTAGTHTINFKTNDFAQLALAFNVNASQIKVKEIVFTPVELTNEVTIQGENMISNVNGEVLADDAYNASKSARIWVLKNSFPIDMAMPFAVKEVGTYDITMGISSSVADSILAQMQYKIDNGEFVDINEDNFTVISKNTSAVGVWAAGQYAVVKLTVPVELADGAHTFTLRASGAGEHGDYDICGWDYINIKYIEEESDDTDVPVTVVVNPTNTTATGNGVTVNGKGMWHTGGSLSGTDYELNIPVEIAADGFYDVIMDIAAFLEMTSNNDTGWYSRVKYAWDSETNYKYLKTFATADEPEVTALHVSGVGQVMKYKLSAPEYLTKGTHTIKFKTNEAVPLVAGVAQVDIQQIEFKPVELTNEVTIQGENMISNVTGEILADEAYDGGKAARIFTLKGKLPIDMGMPFALNEAGTYDITMGISSSISANILAKMQYKIDNGAFVDINTDNFTIISANTSNVGVWAEEQYAVVKLTVPVELDSGAHTFTLRVSEAGGLADYDICGWDYIRISQTQEITAIELASDTDVIYAGDTLNLVIKSQNGYELAPYDYTNVVYTLSDENIATIENGVLTSVNTGLLDVDVTVTLANGDELTATKTIYIVSDDGVYVYNPTLDGKTVTFDVKAKTTVGEVTAIVARYGTQNGNVTSLKEVKTFDYTNVTAAGTPVSHTFTAMDDTDVVYILLWDNMDDIKPMFNRVVLKKK